MVSLGQWMEKISENAGSPVNMVLACHQILGLSEGRGYWPALLRAFGVPLRTKRTPAHRVGFPGVKLK